MSAVPAAQRSYAADDPWGDQRYRNGLNTLVRVIDLDADRQEFILLVPPLSNRHDLRDLEFDGCTFILPKQERAAEEVKAILARYDAAYWADPKNKETRTSVLDRERYLFA